MNICKFIHTSVYIYIYIYIHMYLKNSTGNVQFDSTLYFSLFLFQHHPVKNWRRRCFCQVYSYTHCCLLCEQGLGHGDEWSCAGVPSALFRRVMVDGKAQHYLLHDPGRVRRFEQLPHVECHFYFLKKGLVESC